MTLAAFAFTFAAGSVFGAGLMTLAVIRSERLRRRQVARWFALWIKEANKSDKAEAALAQAQAKLSRGGRKAHENYRARVRDTAEQIRAEIKDGRKSRLRIAA